MMYLLIQLKGIAYSKHLNNSEVIFSLFLLRQGPPQGQIGGFGVQFLQIFRNPSLQNKIEKLYDGKNFQYYSDTRQRVPPHSRSAICTLEYLQRIFKCFRFWKNGMLLLILFEYTLVNTQLLRTRSFPELFCFSFRILFSLHHVFQSARIFFPFIMCELEVQLSSHYSETHIVPMKIKLSDRRIRVTVGKIS